MKRAEVQKTARSNVLAATRQDIDNGNISKKRKRTEINYNESLSDDNSIEQEDIEDKASPLKLIESLPYKRARHDASELVDFAAKEKKGDFLRDSVVKIVQTALLDIE